MKKIILLGAAIVSAPLLASAAAFQGAVATTDIWSILSKLNQLLSSIIPVLITLAVVYFIWGVIQYTVSTDEEAKKGARGKIIGGLIGLFIIIAFWGILSLITTTTGVGSQQLQSGSIPCIPSATVDCTLVQ